MRKLLLGLSLFAIVSARPAATVYVCDSSGSVAYHAVKDCSGLNRCTHRIVAVSESDAVNTYRKRKCQKCY